MMLAAPAASAGVGLGQQLVNHLPVIGGITKALGGLFGGGKSDEQKLAEAQFEQRKKEFAWQQAMDRTGAQYTADDRAHGQVNANATNPSRRYLLAKIMGVLGGQGLPGMEEMLAGQGPSVGRQPNPLATPNPTRAGGSLMDRIRQVMSPQQGSDLLYRREAV